MKPSDLAIGLQTAVAFIAMAWCAALNLPWMVLFFAVPWAGGIGWFNGLWIVKHNRTPDRRL